MNGRCTRVEVSVEIGSDPITGEVAVGAARPEPFSGWIELVAAIEAARSEQTPGPVKTLG